MAANDEKITEEEREFGRKVFARLGEMHPDAKCGLEHSSPFQLLVAVMLSAQCTDERVNKIASELFARYDSAERFAALDASELYPLVRSAGLGMSKARHIIGMSRRLTELYGGRVPRTMAELVALDGVGRKTASVVLSEAFGIPAMPVDTHVLRTSNRIGLARANAPEKAERRLMALFDESQWNALHRRLVLHGRTVCKSRAPDCANCGLSALCAYCSRKAGL